MKLLLLPVQRERRYPYRRVFFVTATFAPVECVLDFTRIGEKGAYSHLLGTVQDITDAKNRERKVQRSEERAEQEMKLLLRILHLNPEMVR